jgi:DNA-binding transcriptional ArsR family regulator
LRFQGLKGIRVKDLNETHKLLMSYAATYYTPTVSGTIPQLISWYERTHDTRIPERTFTRHTRKLADAGLIETRHSGRRTYYTLLGFEFEVPKVVFVPVGSPGQSVIRFDGTETVSYESILADTDPDVICQRVVDSIDPADIDALQDSWAFANAA